MNDAKHVTRARWWAALVGGLALAAGCAPGSPGAPAIGAGGGKADGPSGGEFPAAADLAVVVPMDDARIWALEVLPSAWLGQVDRALAAADLGESIADESRPGDWRLVSARLTICAPLGRVADPAEIDRLCWPQIRLVWQPIVEDARVGSTVRPYYADDRAIHALYRVDAGDPALAEVLARLDGGARLASLDPAVLARFERARDAAGLGLLEAVRGLRGAPAGYDRIDVRPELDGRGDPDAFYVRLAALLAARCPPTALHELTAFSLPTGRNPASAELWSFVAFAGRGGALVPQPLRIHDPRDGAPLFAFPRSEDVSSGAGDGELDDALAGMPPGRRAALEAQVVRDIAEVPAKQDRIVDPYRTLVANTSCSSCHRMTDLDFNFHNLSYFEDHGASVSPRVVRDVDRDVRLARRLWAGPR